jgi:N-acetylglutamate synthase-like GNAT family acetyltransferase
MERELWEDTGFPLFRAVLREAEQCGIKRLFLCAGTSLSLFRSLGFTEMDPALLPEEWQEWVVEKEGVWMVCLLSAQESLS